MLRRFAPTLPERPTGAPSVARRDIGGGAPKALSTAATHVARVHKLFPGRSEEVSRLALRNDRFRSLCEEYGLAAEALDRLEVLNQPKDAERVREFRTLVADLTEELKHEFMAANDVPGS